MIKGKIFEKIRSTISVIEFKVKANFSLSPSQRAIKN